MEHPCNGCIPCRINRAQVWTTRLMLESYAWADTSFLTLTYDEENTPTHLKKTHLQGFFKRLRKQTRIKYYACGEYGPLTKRPHYHAVVFGISPLQEQFVHDSWQKGFVQVGEFNRTTANYVTGYVIKAWRSKFEKRPDGLTKEFALMSQGLGRSALDTEQLCKTLSAIGKSESSYHRIRVDGKPRPIGRYLTTKLLDGISSNPDSVRQRERTTLLRARQIEYATGTEAVAAREAKRTISARRSSHLKSFSQRNKI